MREWTFRTDLGPLPNTWGRMHWAVRGRIRDTIHWQVAMGMGIRSPLKTPVTVQVTRCSPREPDPDALPFSAKYVLDALVSLGIIPDDTSEHVRLVSRWQMAGSRNAHMMVTVKGRLA